MSNNKVKFYGNRDFGSAFFLPRVKEIIDAYIENPKELSSMAEAIELQNVIKFIDAEMFLTEWSDNYIRKIKDIKPELVKIAAKYMGTAKVEEIISSMGLLDFEYRDDFFENFDRFNYAKKISENDFMEALIKNKISIHYLMKSEYYIKVYSSSIKKILLENPLNIEMLLSNFSDTNSDKLYFPENILKADWDMLLDKYIEDPSANINYLSMLGNPIKNLNEKKYFTVTAKQKIKIKKRFNEYSRNLVSRNSGVLVNTMVYTELQAYEEALILAEQEMDLKEALERSILNNIIASVGESEFIQFNCSLRALINRNEINSDHSFSSLLKYFCEDFEFFSKNMISNLPSYPNEEMGTVVKNVGIKTNNSYDFGFYFEMKTQLSISKIQTISSIFNSWNLRIEDLIEWFFTEYCKEKYDISWLPLNMPHQDESIGNRTSILFRIEENIRKQYFVFSEEKEIEKDLVNETPTPSIEQLKSLSDRKYVYIAENDTSKTILRLLFDDQSQINYISEEHKGDNFVDLIMQYDLKMSDFNDYQKPSLRFLIDNEILEEKNEILQFKNLIIIEFLYEIYMRGSTSYINTSIEEKVTLMQMEKNNLIAFSNTLFTKQESDYLNFLLNAKVFDNSLAIRNKYQHGAPNYDDLNLYEKDNSLALLVLIMYMVKIDDDVNCRIKNSTKFIGY